MSVPHPVRPTGLHSFSNWWWNASSTSVRQTPLRSTTAEWLFAGTVTLVIVVLSYVRLQFGAIFADEAYYIAIPLRFVRGDRPFGDEITTLFSMFAFITYPFYKLRDSLGADTTGLVTYSRHLYFAAQCVLAGVVYWGIRRIVSGAEALLLASLAVAFVPFNIAALSYNTIAEHTLLIGLFALTWGIRTDRRGLTFIAGLALSVCVIVYPTLAPLWVFILVLVITGSQHGPAFFVGSAVPVLLIAPFLAQASIANLRESLTYYQSLGHHDSFAKKVFSESAAGILDVLPAMLAFAVAYLVLKRTSSPWLAAALFVIPVLLFIGNRTSALELHAAHQYMVAVAMIAPFVVMSLAAPDRSLLVSIWVPSAMAALAMAVSSTNGYRNAGVGFFTGAVISVAMLLAAARGWAGGESMSGRWSRLGFAAASACILVGYQYRSMYWDSDFRLLTARISSGPYQGIRTTPEKASLAVDLQSDLAKCCTESERIVFYQDFPAGYLFSNAPAATNAVWLASASDFPDMNTSALGNYYAAESRKPAIIVRMLRVPWAVKIKTVQYQPTHPIDGLIASGAYSRIAARSNYEIWKRAKN